MSTLLQAHFDDYASYHGDRKNELCHVVGIPLILVGGAGLLVALSRMIRELLHWHPSPLTLAEVFLVGSTVFYGRLDRRVGVLMAVVMGGFVAFGHFVPAPWSAALFLLGWGFQFVGHYVFEGKAPAFAHNLGHLLVGPAWLVVRLLSRVAHSASAPRPR